MRNPIHSLFLGLLTASVFTLAGCGVDDTQSTEVANNQSQPVFSWSKVTQSSHYTPSGDITTPTPTFTWTAVPNATDYVFGHESTYDESLWTQYELSSTEANCQAELPCSYTPNDFTFEFGDQKAWWLKAKVSGVWQDWSAPSVFTVVSTGQTGKTTAISPVGEIKTTEPEFMWESRPNATKYRLGYDNTVTANEWTSFTIPADDACNSSQICSFTSGKSIKVNDNKTWWVQAFVAGAWENWSDGLNFTVIEDNTSPLITAISPNSEVETLTPEFTWSSLSTATDYQIGYAVFGVDKWNEINVSGESTYSCSSDTCSYTLKETERLSPKDNVSWWVRPEENGSYGPWSNGLEFSVSSSAGGKTPQTITFDPLNNLVFESQQVTTQPLVTSASSGLEISYSVNSPLICGIDGNTVFAKQEGTCSITATQAGDTSFEAATPVSQSFVIDEKALKAQTITFDPLDNLVFESQQVTTQPLVASASSGLEISFSVNSPLICGIDGNTVFAKQEGTCSITATQAGDSSFEAATPVSQSFVINKKTLKAQTINFEALTNSIYKPNQEPLNVIQATASSGLPVSVEVTTPDVCNTANNSVFAITAGTCSISATQSGNSDYLPATPVTQSFDISKAPQSYVGVTRTNGPNTDAEVDQTIILELTTDQTSHGTSLPLTITTQTPVICALENGLLTGLEDGICSVTVTRSGNENYLDYSANYEIEILKTSNVLLEILSNNVTDITTNSASIQWTLTEIADGQIEYGTSDLYGSTTTKETILKLDHSQILTGLQANTVYHYRVTSEDQDGEIVKSEDKTFKTLRVIPPNPTLKRILPLGDSITHGAGYNFANPAHSSYRDELYDLLNDAQFEFEYVGTGSSIYTLGNGNTVELRHEGHPSWRADAIDANLNSWLASYGVPVDIALVHAGTNDILQNQGTDADTLNDIENIISKLQANNSEITILIAKIIPIESPDISVGLNSLLTNAWAVSQSTSTSKVSIVDHNSGFTSSDLYTDLIHPTVSGELKMAETWFEAITNTTPPINNPVLPIQDSSLTLWLDASDSDADGVIDTNMANTANSSWSWQDKSSKGNDVTTIVSSLPPTQIENGLKNKPVFDFATTGLSTATPDQITPNTSYTKFVVFKLDSIFSENNLVSSDTTALWGGFTDNLHAWHNYANYIDPKTPAEGLPLEDSSVGTSTYNIASTRYGRPDNVDNVLSLNSILQNSNQTDAPFFSSVTYIGSIGSDFYLDGKIAEAIIYDRALTDAEIQQVEDYLRSKWF